MREPSDADLLTLDQAAERVGLTDTRRYKAGGRTRRAEELLRAIEAREQPGRPIAVRKRGPKRTTIRVTMHALREHVPEFFPGERTRWAEEGVWRHMMAKFDQVVARKYDPLEGRVTETERVNDLQDVKLDDVAERLVELAAMIRPTPRPDGPIEKKSDCSSEDAESTLTKQH